MKYLALALSFAVILFFVMGCITTPSCYDNPRRMNCMTADQLERELNHVPVQ